MHYLLTHAFEHVRRKGPTKIMSTTTGEHGHVEFKTDAVRTNFTSLESQVSYLPFLIINLILLINQLF